MVVQHNMQAENANRMLNVTTSAQSKSTEKLLSLIHICRTTGEKEADDLVFTRQMAALYNKDTYDGKERVLEICLSLIHISKSLSSLRRLSLRQLTLRLLLHMLTSSTMLVQ